MPKQDWPIGKQFQVSIERHLALADHVRLAEYEFSFMTPAFEARIAGIDFHQDPVIAANKKVVTNVAFSHPVDALEFEKHIKLEMFDRLTDTMEKPLKAPAFSVVYDKHKLNAYVHTAQLEVPAKAGRLQFAVEPGIKAAKGSEGTRAALATSVEIPGRNSLKIAELSLDIVRDEQKRARSSAARERLVLRRRAGTAVETCRVAVARTSSGSEGAGGARSAMHAGVPLIGTGRIYARKC